RIVAPVSRLTFLTPLAPPFWEGLVLSFLEGLDQVFGLSNTDTKHRMQRNKQIPKICRIKFFKFRL
ncbi:hypothetical protein CFT12S05168_09080, partial [Campylobacter fetus subsp. testudinum]